LGWALPERPRECRKTKEDAHRQGDPGPSEKLARERLKGCLRSGRPNPAVRIRIRFRYDASYYPQKMKTRFKPSLAKAILTDEQFWVPVVVLALGIIFLVFVDKP
jgi:hypothetical protein